MCFHVLLTLRTKSFCCDHSKLLTGPECPRSVWRTRALGRHAHSDRVPSSLDMHSRSCESCANLTAVIGPVPKHNN